MLCAIGCAFGAVSFIESNGEKKRQNNGIGSAEPMKKKNKYIFCATQRNWAFIKTNGETSYCRGLLLPGLFRCISECPYTIRP